MPAQANMSPQRYARIRQLLSLRQPTLTLCLEQVHNPFNVSAIVRSCDAVGVHELHAVCDKNTKNT
jgi:tRNA (guanosine-2'-O-)-methyltransferase